MGLIFAPFGRECRLKSPNTNYDSSTKTNPKKLLKRVEMGRRKIAIKYITGLRNRQTTFKKRKSGIFKKAFEIAELTGSQVLLVIKDENNKLYVFHSGESLDSIAPFETNMEKLKIEEKTTSQDLFRRVDDETKKAEKDNQEDSEDWSDEDDEVVELHQNDCANEYPLNLSINPFSLPAVDKVHHYKALGRSKPESQLCAKSESPRFLRKNPLRRPNSDSEDWPLNPKARKIVSSMMIQSKEKSNSVQNLLQQKKLVKNYKDRDGVTRINNDLFASKKYKLALHPSKWDYEGILSGYKLPVAGEEAGTVTGPDYPDNKWISSVPRYGPPTGSEIMSNIRSNGSFKSASPSEDLAESDNLLNEQRLNVANKRTSNSWKTTMKLLPLQEKPRNTGRKISEFPYFKLAESYESKRELKITRDGHLLGFHKAKIELMIEAYNIRIRLACELKLMILTENDQLYVYQSDYGSPRIRYLQPVSSIEKEIDLFQEIAHKFNTHFGTYIVVLILDANGEWSLVYKSDDEIDVSHLMQRHENDGTCETLSDLELERL